MKLLAIDTSTERLSLALCQGEQVWTHEGVAGAQASRHLLPAILALLAQAQLPLSSLQAIAFGQGPGAFTGLRTACSVAQGLALGAGLPVLPISTLMCVAASAQPTHARVLAVLDARMDQVYAAAFEQVHGQWQACTHPQLSRAEEVTLPPQWQGQGFTLATNTGQTLASDWPQLLSQGGEVQAVWPQAKAMLTLAAQAWSRGEAVAAENALPVYVRDEVARTTAQRLADKQAGA